MGSPVEEWIEKAEEDFYVAVSLLSSKAALPSARSMLCPSCSISARSRIRC
jgi:hypothetical protein